LLNDEPVEDFTSFKKGAKPKKDDSEEFEIEKEEEDEEEDEDRYHEYSTII
jgi:hypothetical protein